MFKKILLSIAVLSMLLAAETALAQEKPENLEKPKQKQKQRKAVKKQQQSPRALFGKWFGQLKKAYRQNDNEKVGTLIKEMEKKRNQLNKSAKQPAKGIKKPQIKGKPAGQGKGFQGRGMGRRGGGFGDKAFGRQGKGFQGGKKCQTCGSFRGRGFGGQGRGFQGGKMGWRRRAMRRPRAMGGQGWGPHGGKMGHGSGKGQGRQFHTEHQGQQDEGFHRREMNKQVRRPQGRRMGRRKDLDLEHHDGKDEDF